ncbi:N-acetylmuramoyl-L-alanine amidase [Aureimonas ureilytica]|uniref:N-acetylmuramoyl-L-alanine amidase n=1 Tax=Aureimonas ureilytica TaxID=401562 RepID=UPI0009EBA16D|nr:N-acetylmuramoyl-L-alanine amidase [Aureimonas ureilytica]
MRKLTEVIVHCTATVEGEDFTVADIRAWHLARGWKDIGYHFVVYRDGSVHEGRPVEQVGSHVAGRNSTTIGVVYVGGVVAQLRPKDTRTAAQREAMRALLYRLLREHPGIRLISGHRDYAAKACPCFDARSEYAGLLDIAPAAPAHSAIGAGVVTGQGLRLREAPNGDAAVKASLAKGTRLSIEAQTSDWLAVRLAGGDTGWVARAFVKALV